jgi:RES domain-containing protein
LTIGWRLCRAPFAALDGEGARRFGGRWNSPGRPAVYFADHPALAVLEVVVHLDVSPDDLPDDYVLLRVALPHPELRATASTAGATREAGDAWLSQRQTPVLRVASVLVPQADNLLLNPQHPAAAEARIEANTPFRFDPRLLKAP